MAKIDLVKKRKEAKANKPVTALYSTSEELFASAMEKMKLDELIVQHKYKIENYLMAASMFEAAADVPGAIENAQKCRQLAADTERDEIAYRYECALRKEKFFMDSPEELIRVNDWIQLKQTFTELADFDEAKKHAAFCEEKEKHYVMKAKRSRCSVLAVFAAIAMMGFAVWATGFHYYAMGRIYQHSEMFSEAIENYEKCTDLLDADKRLKHCDEKLNAEKK